MKRHFSLLAILIFSLSLMAETFTIVFNSSESDATSASSELTSIVYSATNNCASEIRMANKVYRAKEDFGIKGGTGDAKGELCLGLNGIYHITTMTVYAAPFVTSKGAADNKKITVCGKDITWNKDHFTEIYPYPITLDKDLDSIIVLPSQKTNNRWYIQQIEFEAEDPNPQQAVMEMPYSLTFESVKWESDEPMEDLLSVDVIGKHIDGEISLSLKSGKNFSLSATKLPAEGGELEIQYSIQLDEITKAYTYKDVLYASSKGLDGVERKRELPLSLTITPPSGEGSTINLDTTNLAIGPMPADYYKFAQNTMDSTLKNHLGAIICVGKRYRYGSGKKHTWAGFYFTDRDTLTNQVLDMYSNEKRYFNPEKPTASVAGFDIEHMLPKSWWGGTVNAAYCDLYHLVPGDFSANRSKSNHAPGIPTDSTFNNGSFVTGSGSTYGLQRVFCPEDQYKGDFARAYFYIATCYGDSLRWVETGEPAVAMTNNSWQEFQPWLRDLLVEWHHLDPVSEKEKARAIEVNKIQGNRNPFIDYPELVDYIWGDKQGTEVDFKTLTQSYGDVYNDDPDDKALDNTDAPTPVYKQIRDGQLIIIRNTSIYTPLGQIIR